MTDAAATTASAATIRAALRGKNHEVWWACSCSPGILAVAFTLFS
jgi:hypothetical protein